jgi:hypothetical protein
MRNYYLLSLMWFPFVAPEPSSCDLCMCTARTRSVVTRTSLSILTNSYAGSVIGSCTHNHTTYLVCSHGNRHICFNPSYHPRDAMVRSICHPGNLVRHPQVFSPDEPVSVLFAAFAAVDKGGCGGTGSGCGGLA